MLNGEQTPSPDLLDRLTVELQVIVRAGLDRPFFRKDNEADIPNLIALAQKLVSDDLHGLHRQIAEAVRAAIEQIVPASRRTAVAELFGTDLTMSLDDDDVRKARPKLDGDRRPTVAKLLGVTESSYLREPAAHEEPLRREVAEHLLRAVARSNPPAPPPDASADFIRRLLDRVAQDTATLHCAILASLFVRSLHTELFPVGASGSRIYVHGRYRAEYDCADAAFLAYLRWLNTYHRHIGVDQNRDQVCAHLGNYLMRQFDALSQAIEQLAGEEVPENWSANQTYYGVYQGVKHMTPVKHKSYSSVVPIAHHFETKWLPVFASDKFQPHLGKVVAKTGLLISLIADGNSQKELEFLGDPRRITLNRLISYYAVDDQESLADGESLRTRAETYLDSQGELAKL